jgi:hypothetical protein
VFIYIYILIDYLYSFYKYIKRIDFRRGDVTLSTIYYNIVGACGHPLPSYLILIFAFHNFQCVSRKSIILLSLLVNGDSGSFQKVSLSDYYCMTAAHC